VTPVRVLVVDDSALMREMLTSILSDDPGIQVVGTAPDAQIARKKIKALDPDVVTLDIEMPGMNGLSFLEKIMSLRPMPVIMVSGYTQANSDATIKALEIGAVDVVAKAKINIDTSLNEKADDIVEKVKAASGANLRNRRRWLQAPSQSPAVTALNYAPNNKIVVVGASAGGVEAVSFLVRRLPKESPPILLTQHMPSEFTGRFASRLNASAAIQVSEARNGEKIVPGHMYIAPGDCHLEIGWDGENYVCKVDDGPPISGHRPSVDVLFSSAAEVLGDKTIGLILTGMGKDGSNGMLKLRDAGGVTFGQDEKTAVIYGMPRVAFEIGAVQHQLPLPDIPQAILDACGKR